MNKISGSFLTALFISLASFGCAHSSFLPHHDEVLIYPLPYDLAFLRTLEAVQEHKDWDLDWTDKEMGVISIRNMRYSSFADADRRQAFLIVKRLNSKETSVQFDPKSQSVVGGDEILKLVRGALSREAGRS